MIYSQFHAFIRQHLLRTFPTLLHQHWATLAHANSGSNDAHTHLCTCALVFRIRCTDIQQELEKIPLRTFSVRIWGPFPLSLSLSVRLHAPVLCFFAINSGGLLRSRLQGPIVNRCLFAGSRLAYRLCM